MNLLRFTLFLSFAASGFAGLVYESIWSRYLSLFLGHAAYAQTLVIALFMGGLSLGSWLASRHSPRRRHLLSWYAAAEAAIGLMGLLFHPLFDGATRLAHTSLMPALGSPEAAGVLKLALSGLIVLPPAILLGTTFPLMSAGVVRLWPRLAGSSISMLYFSNSIGAAAGVLASGFLLVGTLGLPGTIIAASVLNLAVAAVVYAAARFAPDHPPDSEEETAIRRFRERVGYGLMLWVAALTGAASFVYEIAWIRMLGLVLGSSTHSFELMLSAFISGLAFGGLWIRRRMDGIAEPVRWLAAVQCAMAMLALATVPVYANCFELMAAIMKGLSRTGEGYVLFNLASHSLSLLVMFPATFCAGMTLPLITFTLLAQGAGERSIGAVYAANTVGAIAGVVAATHVGMPLLGLKGLVAFGAAVDLGLAVLLLRVARGGSRLLPAIAAGAGAVAVVAVLAWVRIDPLEMVSGVYRYGELISADRASNVFHKDGKTTSVDLVRYSSGRLVIFTNGKAEASINLAGESGPASDEVTMVLSAALPLAAHPGAANAAVIGLGSGQTSHVLLGSSRLEQVDTIEIEAAVVEAAPEFGRHVERVFTDRRSRIFIDDARSFLSARNAQYDLIVAEPSNPWVSGVSSLFSAEFYELAERHLRPRGILAQWLQLYELEPRLVASVMGALARTFPDYDVYATDNANILILARKGGPVGELRGDLFADAELAGQLRRHHIHSVADLETRRIAGSAALQPVFDSYEVPPNSDYYPFLDLNAVRSRFLDHSASGLMALRTSPVPVLDLLQARGGSREWRPPSAKGGVGTKDGYALLQLVQSARAIRAYLVEGEESALKRMPPSLRADAQICRRGLQGCFDPVEAQQWLGSLYTLATVVNPALGKAASNEVWNKVATSPCYGALPPVGKAWISLFAAIGARDAPRIAANAEGILARSDRMPKNRRGYLLSAAMAGRARGGDWNALSALWGRYGSEISHGEWIGGEELMFRLLRAHSAADGVTEGRTAAPRES